MDWTKRQTRIDISGAVFPKFVNSSGGPERFWFVKEEFLKHSQFLLNDGRIFAHISARRVDARWVCAGEPVSKSDIAIFLNEMRLFYMKNESMSIFSFCTYMEKNIANIKVQKFFKHMRESWEEYLKRDATLFGDFSGSIKTNMQLIDAVLYSGNYHCQEKYKKRYDELLEHADESLILMSAYNAMRRGYQMNQISRAIGELREDNLVILLPDHLRHEWDENCPYQVTR